MEHITLLLVHGISVLCGVFLGFFLACKGSDVQEFDDYDEYEVKESEVPDSFVKKVFSGEYFKNEEQPKETVEEKIDNDKRHAFYD